jgi:hypothetical protein
MKAFVLLVLIMGFTTVLLAQPGPTTLSNTQRKWINIAYGTKSPTEKPDIYLPGGG